LYDPKWSEYLYPYDDKFLKNTAQVDPVKPDLCQFPNFSQVKAAHCILNEGMHKKNNIFNNNGKRIKK